MIGAEPDLVLGEDHPARELAAERPLVERRREARQEDAGKPDRDRGADAEVPGAADDLARLALPHVDLAQLELVGVRVLVGDDDLADPEEREVVARVVDADSIMRSTSSDETLSFRAICSRRRVGADVLAQPGERRAHQNCLEKRRSLRQSSRRSGNSWRSIAMRSRPQPKAKPL